MSNYTLQLRYLYEDENFNLFDFPYNLYNNDLKPWFEEKFYHHFMFYEIGFELLDLSSCTMANCTSAFNMLYNCNKLTQLKLDNSVIKSNCNTTNMMYNVQSSCVVTVLSNFGKTESDCNFNGTFTIV